MRSHWFGSLALMITFATENEVYGAPAPVDPCIIIGLDQFWNPPAATTTSTTTTTTESTREPLELAGLQSKKEKYKLFEKLLSEFVLPPAETTTSTENPPEKTPRARPRSMIDKFFQAYIKFLRTFVNYLF